MPISSAMPDIAVEIAWDGGFRIPMADWTWTDVSTYVELDAGITGSWGRGDERSQADANTVTLTLDNSDGRFTAARSTSPYYPDVKLYKPIRVLATPVDGAEVPLFTGYITSWPVQWEDTSAYAKATVTASSRLARLGLNAEWRSIVEEMILADRPVVYYPLSDPEGSTTASDASGNGAAPLAMAGEGAEVVFGSATGPGTDDLTAATFAGGKHLIGERPSATYAGVTVECFFNVSAAPASDTLLMRVGTTEFDVFTTGTIGGFTGSSGDVLSGSVCDGETHHLAMTWDATAVNMYIDGTLTSTDSVFGGTPNLGDFQIGGKFVGYFSGVVAHAAIYGEALSAARIAEHAGAGDDGWAGETTDARFERYAEMAGIPAAEVDAEPGATTMTHVDTTDQNVVDLLRTVETTEAGVLFDALDGTLTLHGRGHRYNTASVLTLDMAKHEVESDYSPKLDPSTLANDITATGIVTAHVIDDDSIEAYGVATSSISTASEDANEPLGLAGWARYKYAEPKPRVAALSVNVTDQASFYSAGESTVSSADLIAVTIGDKITVANHPQQAAVSIVDYFVEGGSFTIGHESFGITWNVSPTDAEDAVFILDSATQGVLDTNVLGL